jgi:hypothetical protein
VLFADGPFLCFWVFIPLYWECKIADGGKYDCPWKQHDPELLPDLWKLWISAIGGAGGGNRHFNLSLDGIFLDTHFDEATWKPVADEVFGVLFLFEGIRFIGLKDIESCDLQ